ncbi:PREDICTED: ELMO domain-containing protein 2 [Nanorana parkeri]|uniref:ELMO domain-containing protein 2 n=1 Tax=Nanorana parkeri TaxID=125878 RepID=UPI000854C225|nr:PREDICTED: ELMO domain-containing protein 2 [Nanorana parkeri]
MLLYFWQYLYSNYFRFWLKWFLRQIHGKCELQRICDRSTDGAFRTHRIEYSLEHSKNKFWDLLMPHENLKSRITKQWGDIGFQGDDPKTDFHGMGILGLTNLLYFSRHYTEESRAILSHSNHPKIGYSYAIVGINLTEMAYSLLKSGALKSHFYNMVPGFPEMKCFHQFFCYLLYEFYKFWFNEEPESIMHFNQYREKFND